MNLYINKNVCEIIAYTLREKLKDDVFYYSLTNNEYDNIMDLIKIIEKSK